DHPPRARLGAAGAAEARAHLAGVEEARLLQHPARRGIVVEMPGDQRPPPPFAAGPDQARLQRLGGVAAPPEGAADPVADLRPHLAGLEQAQHADGPVVLVLDQKGAGALRILPRHLQHEVLGVMHGERMRHAQGHAGDVVVVGEGGEARHVLGLRAAQDQPPGLDDRRGFDHAHGTPRSWSPPPWRARAAFEAGNENGEPGDPDSPRNNPLVRIAALSAFARSGLSTVSRYSAAMAWVSLAARIDT